jgi:hypothetical protein
MGRKKKIVKVDDDIENENIIDDSDITSDGDSELISQQAYLEEEKKEARKLADDLKKKAKKNDPLITLEGGEIKYASELTLHEQEYEFIKCASSPSYFIKTYLTIFDQTQEGGGAIIPFKLFDFQEDLIDTFVNNRFVIANKYRQAGISTATCAYIAWYVMFQKNRTVAIVANKVETARDELMNDVIEFIDGCPTWLKPKTGKEGGNLKDTQKLKRYDNGSELGAFSSKGLRGCTPTLIFWDETAWTEKGDKFWTSAFPSLQTGGRAILVSTPFGMDAVFYKTFDAARRKESEFAAVELWWFNDPRYNKELEWLKNKDTQNEIRMKDENWSIQHRIKLQDDGWEAWSPWFDKQVKNANNDMRRIAQEIQCSFLGSGDNFIAEQYLKRIIETEVIEPIRKEYTDHNMWIFVDSEPGEEYVMAIDVAPGHGDDFSTINILKQNEYIEERVVTKNGTSKKQKIRGHKMEQVAEYYGKLTPQQLADMAYQYGVIYNNAYCVVDITGGHGSQTIERLIDIGYSNLHYAEINHRPSRDRLQGYIKTTQKTLSDGTTTNVDLIPGFFIGSNRGSVLLELQRAIHMHDVIIRSVRLYDELKTFMTVQGVRVADHKRSFHDDSIIGLAIGLYVINYDMGRYKPINNSVTKKMLNALIGSNDVNERKYRDPENTKPMLTNLRQSHSLRMYQQYSWLLK